MQAIERVARALAICRGCDSDSPHVSGMDGGPYPMWTFYIPDAEAALRALRQSAEDMADSTGGNRTEVIRRAFALMKIVHQERGGKDRESR
jgi:hypothetical protein